MSEKILIKKSDPARVLHTELLPYEVPIIFSNDRLYRFSTTDYAEKAPEFVRKLFDKQLDYTIAFDYQIWQGNRNRRTLSLIHPGWQLNFIKLYEDYAEQILFLCSRSPFSLRYPAKVASYYFERDYGAEDDALKTETVDEEPEAFGEQSIHAGSYFLYAKYAQLYRFIDSREFIALEAKLPRLLMFDIKRCFPSIYTHSIAWATKGKEHSKNYKANYSFGLIFDSLMQKANYNETNGIVIGPEVSRIFAEIILQRVDLDILKAVRDSGIAESEFALRRYVDDYYLFTRDERVAERILEIAESALSEYKLYVNEAKTSSLTIPLATPQTIAKRDVQIVFQDSLLSWLDYLRRCCKEDAKDCHLSSEDQRQIRTPYKTSTRLMRDLKIAVKRSGVTYDVVTGYALGSITRALYRFQKANSEHPLDKGKYPDLRDILLIAIEMVFFLYSMDFRVRTTYFAAQFMLLLERATKSSVELRELVVSRMIEHVRTILDSLPRKDGIGIEVLNLLIALKALSPDRLMSAEYLIALKSRTSANIGAKTGAVDLFDDYTYFDFVVILYYIGNSTEHTAYKSKIEIELIRRFDLAKEIVRSAEMNFLLIDIISCPYVSIDVKRAIVKSAFKNVLRRDPTVAQVNQIIKYCAKSIGFINWSSQIELEKLLRRKQLNPAY